MLTVKTGPSKFSGVKVKFYWYSVQFQPCWAVCHPVSRSTMYIFSTIYQSINNFRSGGYGGTSGNTGGMPPPQHQSSKRLQQTQAQVDEVTTIFHHLILFY